jgi:hypothetical protein
MNRLMRNISLELLLGLIERGGVQEMGLKKRTQASERLRSRDDIKISDDDDACLFWYDITENNIWR